MFVKSSLKVSGWVAVEWNWVEQQVITEVLNHYDPLNSPLIKPYVLGGMASGVGKNMFFEQVGNGERPTHANSS